MPVFAAKTKHENTETIELITVHSWNHKPEVRGGRQFCAMSCDYHVLPFLASVRTKASCG